jgi:hypothetical protein
MVNMNPVNQNADGSYKFYGTTQPLYYTYGGWSNPAQIETVFQHGFTGQLYPNGNYDCARCHTTGYNFNASGPEPTTATLLNPTILSYAFSPITDASFSRVPTDGYIAPGTNGTSSWYLTGVQCERCHSGMGSVINQSATALCLECHREETVNTAAHTITPGNGLTGGAYSYLLVSDHGTCSNPAFSNYTNCASGGNTWNYHPSLDHAAGPTFLNSPHSRFSGTLTQNRQNSPDLSVAVTGTYNSQFTDAMVRTSGDSTKNGGCVGCHDPHVTTANTMTLNNNNAAGYYNEDHAPHNCSDCHALSQTIMQTIAHPWGQGTPFPTQTSADINGSCVICHMQGASGVAGNHLMRISVDPNYSTFPTAAQLNNLTNPQTTPNTASDGALSNAVWEDVDIACGQCHIGGNGSVNPYGLVVPPASTNARHFTKAQLADIAANGYMDYYGAGPIHPGDPTTAAPSFTPYPGTYSSAQSVKLTDSTSGVTIYYTTDGSTPNTGSNVYSGTAVPVTATTTIKAIAYTSQSINLAGWGASTVASGTYTINLPPAAAPTFSPTPYTYTTPQSVTLADKTSGVTIYYTTNGSTPTTASTPYTGPIALSTTTTINAIAAGPGYAASPVASATYTFTAVAPRFSPSPYTYTTPQSITLTDTTSGATIYYTTNGTTPTTASTPYTGPIAVSTTTTINAIAAGTGIGASSVTSGTYTIVAPTPTLSPGAFGNFTAPVTVTITDSASGVTIYYTTDGSTPTTASKQYTGPFTVATTTTVKAFASGGGYAAGSAVSGTYTIVAPQPTFSPGAFGNFTAPVTVTITDSAPGVTIYYTTDGSTPTTASTQYTGPFTVSTTTTVKAMASGGGYGAGAVTSGTYTIVAPQPTLSPGPFGSFTAPVTVTLADTAPGVTIYYTTDSSTPTTTSTQYTGPFTVSTTTTVKAIASGGGYGVSSVASGTYTITLH